MSAIAAAPSFGLPPGNFVIVSGHREAKAKLLKARSEIDDWLYELIDAVAFHAADRLRHHAPGSIGTSLVNVDIARGLELDDRVGVFQATAGVEPDFTPAQFGRGLGSDPSDFPVYVDQGTGIYGEKRTPITTIPGYVMGPIPWRGRSIYVKSFEGQPAQHFSESSYLDTIGWLPSEIEARLPELERKIT